MSHSRRPHNVRWFAWLPFIVLVPAAGAQDIEELKRMVRDLTDKVTTLTKKVTTLEGQLEETKAESAPDLEDSILELEGKVGTVERTMKELKAASGRKEAYINISFDSLVAAGWSTAGEAAIRKLEFGDHDPHKRGFTVQNEEMTIEANVDPYFKAWANIVLKIDENGETTIELEEAVMQTLDLPANLQVRAGQYFTEFGRLNPTHPHTWDFVDQPVINSRVFGPDGLRAPGIRLSWLAPTDFPLEAIASVQNANGGTAFSFLSDEGVLGIVPDRPLIDRPVKDFGDLLYSFRIAGTFDLSDEVTMAVGASAILGPNAAGRNTDTDVFGFDLFLKYRPLDAEQGFPFVTFTLEGIYRGYGVGESTIVPVEDGFAPLTLHREFLHDWGLYAQVVWGFDVGWTLGFRYDYANGSDDDGNFLRDERHRFSVSVTRYFTEFSKVRLQYSYDKSDFLDDGDAHSIWFQTEWLIGSHGAHKF